MQLFKAFHFTPVPVTTVLFFTYAIITAVLLAIHFNPPNDIPDDETQRKLGINTTEAWHDLQTLTGFGYHPYNSHANDEVRAWLLRRIGQILTRNDARDHSAGSACTTKDELGVCSLHTIEFIDDMSTNVTIPSTKGLNIHFQGTNIIIHILGEDKAAAPVLVSAHYDSVSTGYGATDAGMAVVSVLQLISHFTHSKTPARTRGLIALLNNGEEDFLNGAWAFAGHPISKLPRTFLNLEGAGAGGRATLFRTTDTEVTRFYKAVKRPFGSVLSDDGFKRKFIRSETDFRVFVDKLAMRGLDLAFWWPRSRYHTEEDNVAHTSIQSVWHMLGASISTLEGMMDYTGTDFNSEDGSNAGEGSQAVWFDIFGRFFVIFKLQSAFAATVTLLILPPIIILALIWSLVQAGKLYLFSNLPVASFRDVSTRSVASAFRGWTTTRGWRGFFRYPIGFVVGTACTIAAAFLVNKLNPFIVYSSLYMTWLFYISVWLFINITIMKGADWWRPSALVRVYAWGWQFIGWWVAMVFVAVAQKQKGIAGLYFIPIFYVGSFFAVVFSLLEMFSLDPQYDVGDVNTTSYYEPTTDAYTPSVGTLSETNESCTENTPLFHDHRHGRGLQYSSSSRRPILGNREYSRRSRRNDGDAPYSDDDDERSASYCDEDVYGREQSWSHNLPQWTWLAEFFVAVPIPLIIVEQLGVFTGTALAQTGADGNSLLTVHLFLAVFSALIMTPVVPFLHRLKGSATLAVFLVLVGTAIYSLASFPFSADARLKVYFQQSVDIPNATNKVMLIGASPFVEQISQEYIPSAIGKPVTCEPDDRKLGLTRCSWEGIMPKPVPGASSPSDWVYSSVNASINHAPPVKGFSSKITILPHNSRACKIFFTPQISTFYVHGTESITATPPTTELRLWSRSWEEGWTIDVEWDQGEDVRQRKAQVVCLWSDANLNGVIPAFDEVKQFLPAWATVSKAADGLVEGWV